MLPLRQEPSPEPPDPPPCRTWGVPPMNQNPRSLSGPELCWDTPSPIGPILIEVPALGPDLQAGRTAHRRTGVTRRRRRLRREVRMAGSALMVVMPLTWVLFTFCGSQPEPPAVQPRLMGVEGVPASFLAVDQVPWVRPVGERATTQACDDQTPVVLPGYVLPEEGCEEPAHAGG